LVCARPYPTYPKNHTLSIRLICSKYIVYNITISEPFMVFCVIYDYVTVTVTCDCDIMLNPNVIVQECGQTLARVKVSQTKISSYIISLQWMESM